MLHTTNLSVIISGFHHHSITHSQQSPQQSVPSHVKCFSQCQDLWSFWSSRTTFSHMIQWSTGVSSARQLGRGCILCTGTVPVLWETALLRDCITGRGCILCTCTVPVLWETALLRWRADQLQQLQAIITSNYDDLQ